jgi:hypothetical protein
MDDDLWWSDEHDVDGKVPRMAKQCHITLIDFGFARALRPDDIALPREKSDSGKREEEKMKSIDLKNYDI